uniref:RB134 n=1 Tax=Ruegeria sp. PR1b TaxID=185588 RepID=Q8KWA8_9RHOB|nr:calcium-binding protein [Ruegeria sp. PR1b]AAN05155.1 RB134 [Ruegeria sp. PR1b]
MAGKTLEFLGRISSGEEAFDVDIRDLDLHATAQGLRLYASTGINGGVASYGLSGNGATLMGLSQHGGSATLASGQAAILPGMGCLVQAGAGLGGVMQQGITAQGAAGQMSALALPGIGTTVRLVAGATLQGGPSLLVTAGSNGTLESWRLNANGSATKAGASFDHPDARALAITDSGVLLVADANLGGLASYRINAKTGALSAADQIGIEDGLPVAGPSVLEVVQAYGQSWAVLGAGQSGSLTVLRLNDRGQMQMVDHLSDTLETRFGQITALELVQVKGRVLVLAGGGDGGLSLLELLPDGRLLHRAAMENEPGQDLAAISAITAAQVGDQLEIYVASQDGAGLARLGYELGDFAGRGSRGTAGDDLLIGARTLSGGAGDDVLVSGSSGGDLTGGAGADLFMPGVMDRPGQDRVVIRDFTIGEDEIDLSAFVSLRSLAGLTAQSRSDGILLTHNDQRILVQSHNGQALELDDIWPAGLGSPHRWLAGETYPCDTVYGSAEGDQLAGTASADIFDGQDGDDRIDGGAGNDQIFGGFGADSLIGGSGNDALLGGLGDDQLSGGAGADTLSGELGEDWLSGGEGGDLLNGDAGNDRLFGEAGSDRLFGGDGNDLLSGGSDNDQLFGGYGNDLLRGNAGNDQLFGGAGNDRLLGLVGNDLLKDIHGDNILMGGGGQDRLQSGRGEDVLKGGAGDDLLVARGGADRLFGGSGRDTLKAGLGDDVLNGGNGADRLLGGAGRDELLGGRGNDILRGGGGADVFVFTRGHGQDRIQDFRPGTDQLDLSDLNQRYGDLEISRAGNATLIDTGAGEIQLNGLRPWQLDADDFLF